MKHQSHSWKQAGLVSLWRYTENQRNYPGWNLTANSAGCTSLIALLDAFEADGPSTTRTLEVTPPTAAMLRVPNNRSSAWLAPSKLRLTHSDNPIEWTFPEALEPATLTIGSDWLTQIKRAVSGIPRGEGDYSIGHTGNGNLQLWFWWQPAAA